ncbi:hypothetical protein A1359_14250 [Methylomonas lenta]|uniref:Uncharacterized protein n=1 Tax=Methylomonas lenta TaxID=980561 RepID=A0A177N1Y5_9GAMM|nr:hypothetical protein A1359_14250 [Methylomonas lenta]
MFLSFVLEYNLNRSGHWSVPGGIPTQSITAIKLRKNNPFSLREKVRMRGLNKAFLPYYKSPLPNPLQQERELFLNLMALTQSMGTISGEVNFAKS